MSAEQIANTRGCLTCHFTTRVDLDYPCTLATNTSTETAKAARTREQQIRDEENRLKKHGGALASALTAAADAAATAALDVPYVANVTQATLEIRKSSLFVERFADLKRREAAAGVAGLGKGGKKNNNNNKNNKNKNGADNAEEEAEILSDPYKAINGAHFVLNALPEIGNIGHPLGLCHFIIDEKSFVLGSDDDDNNGGGKHAVVGAATAVTASSSSASDTLLAVVRVPLHMCTSVGRQKGKETKTQTKNNKKEDKKRNLGRNNKKSRGNNSSTDSDDDADDEDAESALASLAGQKRQRRNISFDEEVRDDDDDDEDSGSDGESEDDDDDEDENGKRKKKKSAGFEIAEGGASGLAGLELIYVPPKNNSAAAPASSDENTANNKKQFGGNNNNNNKNKNNGGKKNGNNNNNAQRGIPNSKKNFPVPYFDVFVNIAGVQYTYLLSSQFDLLAGRKS